MDYFAHAGHATVDAMGFNGAVVFNDLWTLLHVVGLMLLIFSLATALFIVRLARADIKTNTLKPVLRTVSKMLPISLAIIWITGILWAWAFIAGGFVYDWLLIVADIYIIVSVFSLLHTWKLHAVLSGNKTPSRKFYAGSTVNLVLLMTILTLDIFKPSMSVSLIVCSVALIFVILSWQVIADRNDEHN